MIILKHKKGSMNINQVRSINLIRPYRENRGLECASCLENVIIRTALFAKLQ